MPNSEGRYLYSKSCSPFDVAKAEASEAHVDNIGLELVPAVNFQLRAEFQEQPRTQIVTDRVHLAVVGTGSQSSQMSTTQSYYPLLFTLRSVYISLASRLRYRDCYH